MLKELNDALHYIESHLEENLDLDKASLISGVSLFHFKKIFLLLAGIPLLEYIRKRRMTLAGYDLRDRGMKVIDVAIKYGYNSPDSFTKAFYNVHGVNPSEVSKNGTLLKSYSRITFLLTIKGGSIMNYQIVEKKAFTVVGIKQRIPVVYRGENKAITEMGEKLNEEIYNKLESLSNVEPYGGYSVSFNMADLENEEKAQCDHIMGTITSKEDVLGLDSLYVPQATWAIFTSQENTREAIQDLMARIYTEWLPSSQYKIIDDSPGIFFMEDENINDPSVRKEVWVQVKKK